MIEFSMNLSKKMRDHDALRQKIQLRIGMVNDTIPYLNMGIKPFLFTYQDGSVAIKEALSDLNIGNFKYDSDNKRIKTIDLDISLTERAK